MLRDVAQLVARLVWDQNVAGSNPVIPIKKEVRKNFLFLCLVIIRVSELSGFEAEQLCCVAGL